MHAKLSQNAPSLIQLAAKKKEGQIGLEESWMKLSQLVQYELWESNA